MFSVKTFGHEFIFSWLPGLVLSGCFDGITSSPIASATCSVLSHLVLLLESMFHGGGLYLALGYQVCDVKKQQQKNEF
jgi:hypothetical protein